MYIRLCASVGDHKIPHPIIAQRLVSQQVIACKTVGGKKSRLIKHSSHISTSAAKRLAVVTKHRNLKLCDESSHQKPETKPRHQLGKAQYASFN
jgi:bacterioferritin-associated ferredoxin